MNSYTSLARSCWPPRGTWRCTTLTSPPSAGCAALRCCCRWRLPVARRRRRARQAMAVTLVRPLAAWHWAAEPCALCGGNDLQRWLPAGPPCAPSSPQSRKDVEGSLFLVKRRVQPRFQFVILNKKSAGARAAHRAPHPSCDSACRAPGAALLPSTPRLALALQTPAPARCASSSCFSLQKWLARPPSSCGSGRRQFFSHTTFIITSHSTPLLFPQWPPTTLWRTCTAGSSARCRSRTCCTATAPTR